MWCHTLRAALIALALPLAAAPVRAACPSDEVMVQVAAAITSGRFMDPLPGLTLEDAHCARGKLVPLLESAWGSSVGYKAGLTSQAFQRRYGVDRPVHGVMFPPTLSIADGGVAPRQYGIESRLYVEADLIVRVRDAGINDAGSDRLAILRHIDQVIPYIEMPGGNIRGTLDAANLVATNVSARLGVVGRPIVPEASEDFVRRLGEMWVVFTDDGREMVRARGSALLGHPLDVIPWLVSDLAQQGLRLRAGDIVSLGGFAPASPVQPGHTYELRYEGLLASPVTVAVHIAE